MQIIYKKIEELKPAEYNPRKMNEKEARDLTESIMRFGFAEPIVINTYKGRENVIVGGHQRFNIARELKYIEIPCVEVSLTLEREQELNLRLNRNLGVWDFEMLANIDEGVLLDVGFTEDELMLGFGLEGADKVEIDESRFEVITVEPPEAPRLAARQTFHCETIEEFDKLKEYFKTDREGSLDNDKLLKLL